MNEKVFDKLAFGLSLCSILLARVQVVAIILAILAAYFAISFIRRRQKTSFFAIAGIELALIGFSYSFFLKIIFEAIGKIF